MKKITLLIAVLFLTFLGYANKNSRVAGLYLDWTEASTELVLNNWSDQSYGPQLKLQKYFEGERSVNLWNVLTSGLPSFQALFFDEVCEAPTGLNFDNLGFNAVRINWLATISANAKYDVYYSTVSTAPTTGTVGQLSGLTTLTTNITALNSATTYFVWVRSSCTITTPGQGGGAPTVEIVKGPWTGSMSFTTLSTIPYTQGFEADNHGWEFGTGTHVNKWIVGTAAKTTGLRGLYISRDEGVSNLYNVSGAQVTQTSKKILVPAGTQDVSISFDWRCVGDGFVPNIALDYFKVWVMPETFTLRGTLIGAADGGILVRQREYNNSDIFARENRVVNLNQFAGQSVKLVFEWRNDATDGNQPPAAIDNISIKAVTCNAPSNFAYSELTENSVKLSWNANTALPAVSYDIYYSSTPNPIIYEDQVATTENITTNTRSLTGLTPNTKYYAWVRTKCSATSKSYWEGPVSFTTGQVPQQLPYVESFEGTNGWNLNANQTSTQTNKWAVGTAVASSGTKSLYISNNDGVSHEYTFNQAQASHAYRDLTISPAISNLSLTFDWKCFGEGFTNAQRFDYFKIWMVPIDFVPTPGIAIAATANRVNVGRVAYNNITSFTRENIEISTANLNLVGGRGRLVFEWINNRSLGNQPPAAIDNIDIRELTCKAPINLRLSAVTENTALMTWSRPPLVDISSYDLFYSTTETMPIVSTTPNQTGITTTRFEMTGLTRNTVYNVWVRSSCGTGAGASKSYWVGPTKIITTQKPAELPYSEDFEQNFDANNTWTTVFSDKVNKWVKGTAATAGAGKSMYISNNDGVNHAYTVTKSQVSHLYRDFNVPVGTSQISVKFDWISRGEGTATLGKDYLKVWLVPTTYIPEEGVNIIVGDATNPNSTGAVRLGENYYLNNGTFIVESLDPSMAAYAGRTMRLVFEWTNDNAGGVQPPAAIDNVELKVITCPKVKNIMACVSPGSMEIFWENSVEASPAEMWEIVVYPGDVASAEPDPVDVPERVEDEPVFTAMTVGANTTYTVYVRAICRVDDNNVPIDASVWVKKIIKNISYDVGEAEPFCAGDDALIFPNVEGPRGGPDNSKYGSVGCLGSTPNPVWYFLKVRNSGSLNFRIIQNTSINFNGTGLDVDYMAFGPFRDKREACASIDLTDLAASRSFSCSFSGAAVENFAIPAAVEDEIYVLLITNYDGPAGFIKLEQSGGTGITDCSFNCDVELGKDRVICDSDEFEIVAKVSTGGDTEGLVYKWFKDGDPMDPGIYFEDRITVTESGKYEVEVEKVDCKKNPKDSVLITFVKPYAGHVPTGIKVCDLANNGRGVYDIKAAVDNYRNTDPNPNTQDLIFTVHKTLVDATNGFAPISLEEDYISEPTTVYFKIVRKDVKNCEEIFPFELELTDIFYPVAEFKYPAPICINNDKLISPELAENFTEGGVYTVSSLDLKVNPNTGVIDVANSMAGKYSVTYTAKVPQDLCGQPVSYTTEIEIFARFQISYDAECSAGIYRLRVIDLLQNIDLATATLEWSGPESFSSDKKEIVVSSSGTYSVLLTTIDGCYETLTFDLNRVDCMIPKGISPNGDGVNDAFDLSRYAVNSLTMFNRYGKKVYYHGLGYTNQWRGQSDSDAQLPDGTYFYEIVTTTETITGWIQINK